MNLSSPDSPTLEKLEAGLASVLGGSTTVIAREPNANESTFPSEVVRCRLGGRRELVVFCKYDIDYGYQTYGHRGGVKYEAAVYRQVLLPLGSSTPAFYGDYVDRETGYTWLVIEYWEKKKLLSRTALQGGMGLVLQAKP